MADPTPNNPQVQLPGLADTNEPWALEATLNKVLQILQKDFAQGTRELRNSDILNRNVDRLIKTIEGDADDGQDNHKRDYALSKKNQKALQDLLTTSRRQAASAEEAARNEKLSLKQARDNLMGSGGGGKGAGRGGMLAQVVGSAIDKTKDTLTGAAKGILGSGGDISRAMESVASSMPSVMGTVMGASVAMVNDARNQMAEIAKTGQTFNGNMVDFANAAAHAAVSTGQAVAILGQNSEAAAKIGGPQFLKLQRAVRGTTEQFGRFGLSIEDQAKVVGNFYELQMARGRRDQATNAKAAADYTAQMSTLAKMTGKSIDELMATQKDLSQDVDIHAALERAFERNGPEYARNAQKVMDETMMRIPQAAQGPVKELMAQALQKGSVVQSELGQRLVAAGRGDIAQAMDRAMASGRSDIFIQKLNEIGKEYQNLGSGVSRNVSDIQVAGFDQQAIGSALTSLGAMSDKQTQSLEAAQRAQMGETRGDGRAGSVAAVDQTNTALQEKLGVVYANLLSKASELYPAIGNLTMAAADITNKLVGSTALSTAITKTTEALNDMAQRIPEILNSIDGLETLDNGIGSLIGKIADFGGSLTQAIGLGKGIGQVMALLGTYGIAKAGLSAGKRGVVSLAGRMLGGGAAAAGEATVAEGGAAAAGGLGLAGLATLGAGAVGALGVGYLGNKGADALKARGYEQTGKAVSVGSDAAAGAIAGAAIGSVVPVIGTAIGAAIGGGGGALWGLYSNYIKSQTPAQPAAPVRPPQQPPHPVDRPHSAESAENKRNQQKARNQEMGRLKALYDYKIQLEKIFFNYQLNLGKIRHNYEMSLLNQKYTYHNTNTGKQHKQTAAQADAAFRTQVDQAKRIRTSMDQYQDKAAKMGALNQAGVIVQPMLGDDIGSQQLQEMKLTNQFLYNIYDIQRGNRKFKPLVEIYQPGL